MKRLSLGLALALVATACGGDGASISTTSSVASTTSSVASTTSSVASTTSSVSEATVSPTSTEQATTTTEAPWTTVPIVELELSPLPASTLWATFGDGTLARIDGTTAEIESELQVGSVTAMEAGLGSVWMASCEQQALIAVSAQLMEETGRWDLGGCPSDLAVADGVVLVALEDAGKVVSVHPLRDEVTTVIEIESPTAIDAGSPVLVGTADGKVGLWGRHDDGSLKHVWTTQFAGEVVAVNADGFSHLFILVQSPDGSFFVAGIDALSGHVDASWGLNIFEVFDFFIHADWIFAAGGLPGRIWDTNPSGHGETTTDIPDSASGITPNADQTDPPGAHVLGGDENGSSLYTTEGGSGEATKVGDIDKTDPELLAAQPIPKHGDKDLQGRIAELAADAEALVNGRAGSALANADALGRVAAASLADSEAGFSDAAKQELLAAGKDAAAVSEMGNGLDQMNYEAQKLDWQAAQGENDGEELQQMVADAEQLLQKIEEQVDKMEGAVDSASGHLRTAHDF